VVSRGQEGQSLQREIMLSCEDFVVAGSDLAGGEGKGGSRGGREEEEEEERDRSLEEEDEGEGRKTKKGEGKRPASLLPQSEDRSILSLGAKVKGKTRREEKKGPRKGKEKANETPCHSSFFLSSSPPLLPSLQFLRSLLCSIAMPSLFLFQFHYSFLLPQRFN